MPLWDSVQRSLEKASQEAARIARTQRLRSTIDGLARQINTQQNNIFNKVMDMFVAGQLTSSELFPLCQEMMNLQQQLTSYNSSRLKPARRNPHHLKQADPILNYHLGKVHLLHPMHQWAKTSTPAHILPHRLNINLISIAQARSPCHHRRQA